MYRQERVRKPKNTELMLDLLHIGAGIVIVVLAVLSFLSPEDHMLLFPLIFLLAGALNMVNGIHRLREGGRTMKKRLSGLPVLLFGVVLLALAVVSAVSIWWR